MESGVTNVLARTETWRGEGEDHGKLEVIGRRKRKFSITETEEVDATMNEDQEPLLSTMSKMREHFRNIISIIIFLLLLLHKDIF